MTGNENENGNRSTLNPQKLTEPVTGALSEPVNPLNPLNLLLYWVAT